MTFFFITSILLCNNNYVSKIKKTSNHTKYCKFSQKSILIQHKEQKICKYLTKQIVSQIKVYVKNSKAVLLRYYYIIVKP